MNYSRNKFLDLPGFAFGISAGGIKPIELILEDLETLINENKIKPGQPYLVTDLTTGGGALLTGFSSNAMAMEGSGIFLNPDYNGQGNYDGVVGITGILVNNLRGVWSDEEVGDYETGDIVIWNNQHFQVVDVEVMDTSEPQDNPDAYTLLSLAQTNVGYMKEICFILYVSGSIRRRIDTRGNDVPFDSLNYFQFGNDQVWDNIIGDYVSANIRNQRGVFANNKITGDDELLLDNRHKGFFNSNVVDVGATIIANFDAGQGCSGCRINAFQGFIEFRSNQTYSDEVYGKEGSTFSAFIDVSDDTIMVPEEGLVIPSDLNYIGVFYLQNVPAIGEATGTDLISNLPSPYEVKIIPESLDDTGFYFETNTVAVMAAHKIAYISNDAYMLNGRGNGLSDYMVFRRIGDYNELILKQIYISGT